MAKHSSVFYTRLAPAYDDMTGAGSRISQDKAVFKRLARELNWRRIIDLGCGTGHHLHLLYDFGVTGIGIDLNAAMIREARCRRVEKRWAQFYTGSFEDVLPRIDETFDGVLCLGNTLPHIHTKRDLLRIFRLTRKRIKPGGTFIIQLLNYRKILKEKPRILHIREMQDRVYIRYYDYYARKIGFRILSYMRRPDPKPVCISTMLRPWLYTELKDLLSKAGYKRVKAYGDLTFSRYKPVQSANLVLCASVKM